MNYPNKYTGLVAVLMVLVLYMGATGSGNSEVKSEMIETTKVDHSSFNVLLETYVDEHGLVDYASIIEHNALYKYLQVLAEVNPEELKESEAIAFWINAYNAFTIKLIIDHYPVGSIREISPFRIKGLRLAIPKINSPFEYEIALINGTLYSLDDIEHKILRKQFDEPRIHFALVCAALSCPPLRREAYVSERLDDQLDSQARAFLNDPSKNRISGTKTVYLSRIFDWFQKDFADSKERLQIYLSQYVEGEAKDRLRSGKLGIKYLNYDWSLNEQ